MQLIFEELVYYNLLSAGNDGLRINFRANQMTLCVGPNGAGKSSFIDALSYVLFGRAFRDINVPLLINSVNGSKCRAEVTFRTNAHAYKVVRGMKPTIFEIYEDGKKIDQDASSKDYQKVLERILGFNFKTFTQVMVIGSTSFVPFMRLKPPDRRAIIDNLLDIEIYGVMGLLLKLMNKNLGSALEANENAIFRVQDQIELQNKYIEASKRSNDALIDKRRKEKADLLGQITDIKAGMDARQAQIETLELSLKDVEKTEKHANRLHSMHSQLQARRLGYVKERKFLEEHDECPTCEQSIGDKPTRIGKCDIRIKELDDGLSNLIKKRNELETIVGNNIRIQNNINGLETAQTMDNAKITYINQSIRKLDGEIAALSDANNVVSTDVQDEAKRLAAQMKKLGKEMKELRSKKEYLELGDLILKDSGIKARIVRDYIPVINKLINKYLAEMGFFVDFHLDEEFKEVIKSRHRDEYSYESFSEGQKRRIDLALLFTWREIARLKNSVSTNLLIMDEILDGSLDDEGIEEFMKLLGVFGKGTNTFLISHKGDVLLDKFDHVLAFKLNGHFTEMTAR